MPCSKYKSKKQRALCFATNGFKYNAKELKIGTVVELEHTRSRKVARRIAQDHLKEFPKYYTKGLIPMERKLRRIKMSKLKGGKK